ncbi:hypothetical protein C0993_010505, partial [Termitomyces sp. T159_Od127]
FGAETLKKPELYFTVKYIYNETLTFQGTFDPAFTMTVVCSIRSLTKSKHADRGAV